MSQSRGGSKTSRQQRPSQAASPRVERSRRRAEASPKRSRNRSRRQNSRPAESRRSNTGRNIERRSRSRDRAATRPRSRERESRKERGYPDRSRYYNRSREWLSRSRVDERDDYRRARRGHGQDNERKSPWRSPARRNSPNRRHDRDRRPREENPFLLQSLRTAPSGREYTFPTNPGGNFAQAMRSIACNAEAKAQGIFSQLPGNTQDNFREEILQALALKLNFKTTRQANEKALRSMFQSHCSATDLKQTLQARAALYGDLLEPS